MRVVFMVDVRVFMVDVRVVMVEHEGVHGGT